MDEIKYTVLALEWEEAEIQMYLILPQVAFNPTLGFHYPFQQFIFCS